MKFARIVLVAAACSVAGACGQMAELQPAPGQPLPIKPLLATTTPTAQQLLTPPANARPERIDELVKRSEPRQPDRFDLPPPDGGAAPILPETDEPSSSEQAGPATSE
ncbi:MAG TPA: hypothetical protein VMN38_09825 [Sphingomicrobium sp.]|nr:hypothetical protein [Sphingomicrobium sp.]